MGRAVELRPGAEGNRLSEPIEPGLREEEIRPHDLLSGQAERYQADIRWLLDRRRQFVSVTCPACGSGRAERAFQKYELDYVRCTPCETLYVTPRPSPALLKSYYLRSENYAYWNKHIFPASEDARREKIFKPRVARVLDLCRQHGVKTGTLLEIGAAFGTFGQEVQRTGAFGRIVAVEPTPDLARTCRARGLEVLEAPVEELDPAGLEADVVVAFEVIEHLFSPASFLDQCRRLLAPGGMLVLTCPNVKGFDIEILQALSSAVDTEHLNYFHPRSLKGLLARCGYEPLGVETPGQLDAELVRQKALSGEIDLSSRPFLRRVLLEEWEGLGGRFQRFLADSGFSSHMWAAGRKATTC